MDMQLFTVDCKETGISGDLAGEGLLLVTLEHAYPDGRGWAAKLPPGTYTCVRGQHQLHSGPIETFEVTGVPGHTGILFHIGNTQADSEGCILLGLRRGGDSIYESRKAFAQFMELQKDCDSFTLVVT